MSNQLPLLLHEACLTLYPASADGTLVTGGAIFSGALANHFRDDLRYETVKVMGSGELYSTEHATDEETLITIDRTWILPKGATITDFTPARNQQYVLQLQWYSEGYWYGRTYYGVTPRQVIKESQGTNQFLVNQGFRAQYSRDAGGPQGTPVYTPVTAPAGTSDPFGFFREAPFVVGEFLLGAYVFEEPVTLGQVAFVGLAPTAETVLTLVVNGAATGQTLTIAAGTANTEVTAEMNLNGMGVTAGQTIQWQITSGPIPENAISLGALVMQVATVT